MFAISSLIKTFISLLAACLLTLSLFIGLNWIITNPSGQVGESKRTSINWNKPSEDSPEERRNSPPPPPPKPPEVPLTTPSPLANNPAPAANLAPPIDLDSPNTSFNPNEGFAGSLDGLGVDASTEMPVHRQAPDYPHQAYSRRIEGWVELEFEVDSQGKVIANTIQVINSQPKNIFDRSAIQAIAKWRFAAFELRPGVNRKLRQRLEYSLGGN